LFLKYSFKKGKKLQIIPLPSNILIYGIPSAKSEFSIICISFCKSLKMAEVSHSAPTVFYSQVHVFERKPSNLFSDTFTHSYTFSVVPLPQRYGATKQPPAHGGLAGI
jgi:hypothetical protein